jgi:hypothetical protein
MSQIDYFKRQLAIFRKALEFAETDPGFAFKETLADGFEPDIAQYKRGLRIAITAYERCIAQLQRDADRARAVRLTRDPEPPPSVSRSARGLTCVTSEACSASTRERSRR